MAPRKWLVVLERGEDCDHPLQWAAAELAREGDEVHVLYCYPAPTQTLHASPTGAMQREWVQLHEAMLDELLQPLLQGTAPLIMRHLHEGGIVPKHICEAASKIAATAIVVCGIHGAAISQACAFPVISVPRK